MWAHRKLTFELDRYFTASQTGFKRAMRQFGVMIPSEVNAGIGGRLAYNKKTDIGILYPDHFLEGDEADVTIAGQFTKFGKTRFKLFIYCAKSIQPQLMQHYIFRS